ncbi:NAD-dependent protein deacetylase sirtuin-2 [Halotydeus destructor]|nr:NAD-dependent protein deacetylase sirtuin-2 [Halotydeus destructor]
MRAPVMKKGQSPDLLEQLSLFFKRSVNIKKDNDAVPRILTEPTVNAIVEHIKNGGCKNIIALVGAGISTSAGIPDFRSPNTGLYANLQKYNLPKPEAIFDIDYFTANPKPFFSLAKELYPGKFTPTPSHYFLRLLHEKGLLKRVFTQNIDMLERVCGIPDEKIVEAHGSFHLSHCIKKSCRKEYKLEWMKEKIFADLIPKCEDCDSFVKPDIVFFGEGLPPRFFQLISTDFEDCDLLLIMGTSLTVQPFASLVDSVKAHVPRLFINMTKCGEVPSYMRLLGMKSGFDFDSKHNFRDVMCLGASDEKCGDLADKLGWKTELDALVIAKPKSEVGI